MSKPPPVALLTVELHFPQAAALKDKRQELKSIKDTLRARFNVSVAEVGDTEKWQTATLAIAAVGHDRRYLEQVLQTVSARLDDRKTAEILRQRVEFL